LKSEGKEGDAFPYAEINGRRQRGNAQRLFSRFIFEEPEHSDEYSDDAFAAFGRSMADRYRCRLRANVGFAERRRFCCGKRKNMNFLLKLALTSSQC